jgi:hypothetical protein
MRFRIDCCLQDYVQFSVGRVRLDPRIRRHFAFHVLGKAYYLEDLIDAIRHFLGIARIGYFICLYLRHNLFLTSQAAVTKREPGSVFPLREGFVWL